jgi:Lysozyme like domain
VPILSFEQVAAVAIKAGFTPGQAVIAVAITNPESGRDSTIVQAGQPYATTGWGLWQITPGDSEPQDGINDQLLNPLNNARAAVAKFRGSGSFEPWTTFVNGLERPYIGQAEAAVEAVTHLSARQLAALVAAAEKGSGDTAGITPPATDWAVQVRTSRKHLDKAAVHLTASAVATRALRTRFRPPAVRPAGPAGVALPIERYRRGQ